MTSQVHRGSRFTVPQGGCSCQSRLAVPLGALGLRSPLKGVLSFCVLCSGFLQGLWIGSLSAPFIALDENSSLSQLSPFSDSSVARTEALAFYRKHIVLHGKGGGWGRGRLGEKGAGVTPGETTMGRAHAVWNTPSLLLPDFISFVEFPFPFVFCPVCQRDGPAFPLPTTVSLWASLVPKWQLCALCPWNWNCHSHLPFPPTSAAERSAASWVPCLTQKTGSGCLVLTARPGRSSGQ